jgi:hypothetical protein
MKCCIIGHPRTRSSVLLASLCSQYEIPIIGENGNNLGNSPSHIYLQLVRGWLKQIESKKEGVVRIHPTQLSLLQNTRNSKMIDISWLNLTRYNKIYFTVRKNISDMISSLFIASTLDKFTYLDKKEVHQNIERITLTPNSYFQTVEILLYSEFIMDELKKYLTLNSIDWEELDYDTIPKHIEEKYSTATTTHVETRYDYCSLVTNYDELQTIYDQLKPVVLQRFLADNIVDK